MSTRCAACDCKLNQNGADDLCRYCRNIVNKLVLGPTEDDVYNLFVGESNDDPLCD